MARSLFAGVLTSLLPLAAALAQPSPSPAASPGCSSSSKPDKKDAPPWWNDEEKFKRFQEKLDKLTPKEREQFRENWMRWRGMGDGERRDWQKRAMEERDRLKQVIDDAIAKTGLKLDADQREVFIVRYRQERRKVEEQLRQEMDAKRRQKVDEILERLKAEFSAAAAKPAASPAPSASPSR